MGIRPLRPRLRDGFFRLHDLQVRRASQGRGVDRSFFLRHARVLAVFQVLERTQIPQLDVLRVLQRDEILPGELFIRDQVPPHLRLDIQPFDRIIRKHIRRGAMPDRHDVRVVREDLVCDGIDVLVLRVARELQLDQIRLFQR